jgi:hypothetical protein
MKKGTMMKITMNRFAKVCIFVLTIAFHSVCMGQVNKDFITELSKSDFLALCENKGGKRNIKIVYLGNAKDFAYLQGGAAGKDRSYLLVITNSKNHQMRLFTVRNGVIRYGIKTNQVVTVDQLSKHFLQNHSK